MSNLSTNQRIQLEELFKTFDIDGNGLIDMHEMKDMFKFSKETDQKYFELLSKIDTDKNGYIDIDEFSNYMSTVSVNVQKVFDYIDESKDGFITAEELRNLYQAKANIPITDDELKIMMQMLTEGQSDTVSREQFEKFFHTIL